MILPERGWGYIKGPMRITRLPPWAVTPPEVVTPVLSQPQHVKGLTLHRRPHADVGGRLHFLTRETSSIFFGERRETPCGQQPHQPLTCPAFTNQILALTLIARLHEMLPASLFDGAIGWI